MFSFFRDDHQRKTVQFEIEPPDGYVFALKLYELPPGRSIKVKLGSRTIALFNPSPQLRPPQPVPEYARKAALKLNPELVRKESYSVRIWEKPYGKSGYPEVYAVDEFCYHEGGPLSEGNIEDWDGMACVICPYHHYAIALENGERFLRDLQGGFKSLGIKQRVHPVHIYKDQIYVKLDVLSTDQLPCDQWQSRKHLSALK